MSTQIIDMRLILISLLTLTITLVHAQEAPYFHSVKTMEGDGVYSLLRRYKLSPTSCNLDKFYEINKMKKDATLKADQSYLIPVSIYTYNGTSIRSTLGIDDWDTAVNIKEYNKYLKDKKLRRTHYIDSKILWVPYSSLHCNEKLSIKSDESAAEKDVSDTNKTIDLPKGSYRYVKLFGDKHANVEIIDQQLKDHVYYLVSGHGGPDPGAQCKACEKTLCEDEYAYDVVLRLARDLMQHGAIVHVIIKDHNDGIRDDKILSCDKDEVCLDNLTIPQKQLPRLVQRASAINNLYRTYQKRGKKNQLAVMIHVDSRENSNKRVDTYFMHSKGSKAGKKIANQLKDTFKAKYDKYQKDRGYKGKVSHRNLFMLNNTQPTAVYVELANIQNPNDQQRIKLVENRQALANWMFEGLTGIK